MSFIGEGVDLKWMRVSKVLLYAEEPGLRLLLPSVYTPVAQ